jgi:hypothetical protein
MCGIVCAQRSLRGKGILIARTDETNPVAIRATRNQSQIIQRRTSRITSASLLAIFPEPLAVRLPFQIISHCSAAIAAASRALRWRFISPTDQFPCDLRRQLA